ncbi:MAG: hypothetical protein JWN99_512 [Ilumatobacteraceae bacterium]|nr:hypothetical protein [Ilumatobacteraceae bacterium]
MSMTPFELLLSADMMVPDPDATAAMLVDRLGIHGHANWRQAFPNHPYIAHFLRVHKSLAVAPTRIEPQGHRDAPNLGDPLFPEHLHSLTEFQGAHRPIKTHSTVLVAASLEPVIERLLQQGARFRLAQITDEMPFDRLWVGVTPERASYTPEVDGGLCIEVIETAPLQLPAATFESPPPVPRDAQPADMVRVTSRGYLVRDIEDVVERLERNLGWSPSGPIETLADAGFRRARYLFSIAHSATLDVIQPMRWNSRAGYFMHNWGPGPYSFCISVNDLDAKADDLRSRGTEFELDQSSDEVGGRPLLRVEPRSVDGLVVQFETAV